MKYEKSCGAVVYTGVGNDRKYLIIFNKKGNAQGHWGFPKGHVENAETEIETAKREIKEETGLEVIIKPFFRAVSHYVPKEGTEKDSVYFIAEAVDKNVSIQQTELADYQWLDYESALKCLTFDGEILQKADKFLSDIENITTVIFDMDGVLVDSELLHYDSVLKTLAPFGKTLDLKHYLKFVGTTNDYTWQTIVNDLELDAVPEELKEICFAHTRETVKKEGHTPVPGAVELVKTLYDMGYTLAVASSSAKRDIEEITEFFGINKYFTELVTGEDVKHSKPAPDVFLKTAEELGKSCCECMVIEDSHNGAMAAKAAGMLCVGLANPNSGEQDISMADYIVRIGFYM